MMLHTLGRRTAGTLCAVLVLAMLAATAPAQRTQMRKVDADKMKEARGEAREAAEDFRKLMNIPGEAIPRELFERTEAIAVFPNIVKAAFIFGGRGGDGVISRRTATGWGAPVYFNLGGGSFGPQIGVSSTDLVLLFMNEGALKGLLEDKFEFGGSVSVAAGPIGRSAGAGTNLTLDAGILSYSRSKGLFAGASLNGAVIKPDNDLNEALYGMKASEILTGTRKMTMNEMPAYVRIFPQTLARYSRMQKSAIDQADGVMMKASYTVGGLQSRSTAPDNSIVTVEVRNGARIETRIFNNPNSRVARVVRATSRDGKRATRVHYRNAQVRELKQGDDENVLEETGDAIADFASSAVDVTSAVAAETAETAKDVASTTADVATDVASATVQGTEAAIEKTGEVASAVGEKTADVAGTVVDKTSAGVKTAASATETAVEKSVDATSAAVEKTGEVAGDVASATASATATTVEATKETATAVGTTTAEVAEDTGSFFERGFKTIGRGFKRVFGF